MLAGSQIWQLMVTRMVFLSQILAQLSSVLSRLATMQLTAETDLNSGLLFLESFASGCIEEMDML